MNVIVAVLRHVVIDDVRNARHVDAAPDDVRRDENFRLFLTEVRHNAVALRLRQVAVNRVDARETRFQTAADHIDATLRSAENDRLTRVLQFEQLHQRVELAPLVDRQVKLLDRVGGNVLLAEVVRFRVAHIRLRQPNDRRGERRAEEERLPRTRRHSQNPLDVRAEPDVQHTVGFVENDPTRFTERKRAAVRQVDDSARRSDENIATASQFFDLRRDRLPAVTGDDL